MAAAPRKKKKKKKKINLSSAHPMASIVGLEGLGTFDELAVINKKVQKKARKKKTKKSK